MKKSINTTASAIAAAMISVLEIVAKYKATISWGRHTNREFGFTSLSIDLHGALEGVDVSIFSDESGEGWMYVYDAREWGEWYDNLERRGPAPKTISRMIELNELESYLRYLEAGVEWDIE